MKTIPANTVEAALIDQHLSQCFEQTTELPESPPSDSKSYSPRLAYSVKETAQLLGICEKSVRRLVARGLLRPSRALRHLLITRKELNRFLEDTTLK
jgi:excisionase family DNA binding protein